MKFSRKICKNNANYVTILSFDEINYIYSNSNVIKLLFKSNGHKSDFEDVFGLQVTKVVSLLPKNTYSLINHSEAAQSPHCVCVVK